MKQLKNFTLKFVGVMIATIAFMLGFASCNDDATTDSTSFALYYTSMTDISPTMTGTIASPTYKGAEPSGFSITGVTFGDDNQLYTGDSFSINETTGAVDINNTSELQIGKYKISVSCIAGGKSYHFQDAIIVNFMKAVPDGITVEPAELLVEYADIINTEDQTIVLPTAQVKTDGNHISIKGYEISGIRKGGEVIENFPNPLFAISNTGEISIVKGNQSIEIGTYVLSLKLNTAVAGSDSEMGLFADAVKINVISKPLSLTYNPKEDLLEESSTNETEYISKDAPVLEGSLEGVNFSIASVSPATDKISIDPETGKIVIAKGHGFKKGESYSVNVLVKNQFCEEGVVFENVFKLEVVEYIEPIANFSYPDTEVKQALKFEVKVNEGFQGGGNLSFAFSEEDKAKYDGILTLKEDNGTISALKYNSLEVGEHEVHVIATNNKGSQEAILKLTITENLNYFTTINYGNNLGEGQSELDGEEYNNQFRFAKTGDVNGKTFMPKPLDLKGSGQKVKWSIKTGKNIGPDASSPTTINEQTGEITVKGATNKQISFVLVTAEVGEGDESIVRTVPFFVFVPDGNNVVFTPFVMHVNPKKGGTSNAPVVNSDNVKYLDYRTNFSYINIDGVSSDGIPHTSNPNNMTNNEGGHEGYFIEGLWSNYYKSVNRGANYGSRDPISYFTNKNDLTKALLYVDNNDGFKVKVPKEKWYNDGWADGVFFAQFSYSASASDGDKGDGTRMYALAIWFDKDYDPKK